MKNKKNKQFIKWLTNIVLAGLAAVGNLSLGYQVVAVSYVRPMTTFGLYVGWYLTLLAFAFFLYSAMISQKS